MNMYADRCNRCGKTVIKGSHNDSSDMVITCDSFLYMCDIKPGESSRPTLSLKEYYGPDIRHMYCLDCLVEVVGGWVKEMKERGPSKIRLDHILCGEKGVTSPCPVCGK